MAQTTIAGFFKRATTSQTVAPAKRKFDSIDEGDAPSQGDSKRAKPLDTPTIFLGLDPAPSDDALAGSYDASSGLAFEQYARMQRNKHDAMQRKRVREALDSDFYGHLHLAVPPSWRAALAREFAKPYWGALCAFLAAESRSGQRVFPPSDKIFAALEACAFDRVRVVVLGQDPYHGAGQAEGLCFSVPKGQEVPPSLVNIYKELCAEYPGRAAPAHGSLEAWARQGVLLLNATLTVRAHAAASHQKRGWEQFTDALIRALDSQRNGLVFMLWGAAAQEKGALVSKQRHLVLSSVHPSPLSAYRGFLGNGHFVKANEYLVKLRQEPIDWTVEFGQCVEPDASSTVAAAATSGSAGASTNSTATPMAHRPVNIAKMAAMPEPSSRPLAATRSTAPAPGGLYNGNFDAVW